MKRLFIAIKIESNEQLQTIISDFKKSGNSIINWADPNKLHLTLEFLGNIEESIIENINTIIDETCRPHKAFELELSGVGTFGNQNKPHVLWVGIKHCPELMLIQNSLHLKLQQLGLELEQRPFNPHVTLGRIKKIENIQRFNEIIIRNYDTTLGKNLVKSIVLFESALTPSGPYYIELSGIKLQD